MNHLADLAAGDFSKWMHSTQQARVDQTAVDVACGECSACCTSSYVIHVGAEEARSLARISEEMAFPVDTTPPRALMMAADPQGCCPMLSDGRCSIYDARPLICRQYDCRMFAAAGIADVGGDGKALITEQVRRWQFDYAAPQDVRRHAAIRMAAIFLRLHASEFPSGLIPPEPTQLATVALRLGARFLEFIDGNGEARGQPVASELVQELARFLVRDVDGQEIW